MTQDFCEDDVLLANPPLIESQGKSHELHRAVRQHGNPDNVEKLLHVVCISSQKRVGVLCEVVSSVESPEEVRLVRCSVKHVVPKVEGNCIDTGLNEKPQPWDRGWRFVRAISEEDGHQRTKGDDRHKSLHCDSHTDIRDTISTMLITVKESIAVTNAAKKVNFMDGNDFESQAVENHDRPRREVVAEIVDEQLVQDKRDTGVDDHVAMEVPFFCIRDFVCLWVDWDIFIEILMVHVQQLKEPVVDIPLFSVP